MTISPGDKLPQARFRTIGPDGPDTVSSADVFGGKTVALFAVPGAFTPTCHLQHLPGFLKHAGDFKARGVDEIVCVAVNDPFVVDAWSKASDGKDAITFLSDADASFTKALGLEFDGSGAGLGTRSKRYAMLVEDGVVKTLNVEGSPSEAEVSSAENLLKDM